MIKQVISLPDLGPNAELIGQIVAANKKALEARAELSCGPDEHLPEPELSARDTGELFAVSREKITEEPEAKSLLRDYLEQLKSLKTYSQKLTINVNTIIETFLTGVFGSSAHKLSIDDALTNLTS